MLEFLKGSFFTWYSLELAMTRLFHDEFMLGWKAQYLSPNIIRREKYTPIPNPAYLKSSSISTFFSNHLNWGDYNRLLPHHELRSTCLFSPPLNASPAGGVRKTTFHRVYWSLFFLAAIKWVNKYQLRRANNERTPSSFITLFNYFSNKQIFSHRTGNTHERKSNCCCSHEIVFFNGYFHIFMKMATFQYFSWSRMINRCELYDFTPMWGRWTWTAAWTQIWMDVDWANEDPAGLALIYMELYGTHSYL